MLVIDPGARGRGLGRLLTEECVRRARRDGAPTVALHTSPIMEVALPMYLRMGFTQFTLGFSGPDWKVDAGAVALAWRDEVSARSTSVAVTS